MHRFQYELAPFVRNVREPGEGAAKTARSDLCLKIYRYEIVDEKLMTVKQPINCHTQSPDVGLRAGHANGSAGRIKDFRRQMAYVAVSRSVTVNHPVSDKA